MTKKASAISWVGGGSLATFLPGVESGGGLLGGCWGSTELFSYTHLGDRPSPGLTLGVTFAKEGLFFWGVERRGPAWIRRAGLPQSPKPAPPIPPHTRLAKLRGESRQSQRCEKADSCYICMTILLYFSEQTSVVYVPVCPDPQAPLPAAPSCPHSLCCDLTSSS